MEERELVRLLQRAGDRVSPGPAPLAGIVREGRALRVQRRGRVRVVALVAAAAAVVGGGSLAATVVDLRPLTGGADSEAADAAGGSVDDGAGAGGGQESATDGGGQSAEPMDAATATVEPGAVAAGGTVTLTPDDVGIEGFGLAWSLERRTVDGWTPEYVLVPAHEGRAPTWWPAGEDRFVEDVLLLSGTPLRFVVPPDARPGEHRICQETPTGRVCGLVDVTG